MSKFSRRSGFGWLPAPSLLAACLTACSPDVVQHSPSEYYAVADDAAVMIAPSATTQPTAETPDAGGPPSPPSGGVDANLPSEASSPTGDSSEPGAGPTSPCDLSGRWIATDHQVQTGLGAQEAAHIWYYFELSQTGSAGTVTRGLDCGENVRGISAVAANVDFPKVWPALLTKVTQTGRKFTSAAAASGCTVSFEQRYTVLGATVSFYSDPSQTLPTASQQAMGSTPGWEDWDNDGNPGVTMNTTGLVTGQVYIAVRRSTIWSGTIAASASDFKLADNWTNETDTLGYNGSSLLTSPSSKDNDASLHFIEFARLSATQATGDDATTCTAIRSLAASLTPSGAGN